MLKASNQECPIGRSGLSMLRRKSPFATLLLEIAQAITDDEFANMKLYVFVDRKNVLNKKQITAAKFPADLLLLLEDRALISKHDVDYLRTVLLNLGRKDLEKVVDNYKQKTGGNICV